MLFIYGALPVGGIETFFVRMAKERFQKCLPTSVLLLSKPCQSNYELLSEMKKYANVIYPEDIFYGPTFISQRFPLLSVLKAKATLEKLKEVNQIHAFDGMHALLGYRISKELQKNIPITVGFYHYIKYLWGGDKTAWHETVNRKFIFNYLPEEALLFLSEGNRELYIRCKKQSFEKSHTFRLGVVDKKEVALSGVIGKPLKIVAVGRLVEFKTYNLYMVDVVERLTKKGLDIQLDIYGDGPLYNKIQEKIEKANLQKKVVLKGAFDYSEFDEIIANYDLFICSGTAIIQASSLGVPSIVGVENMLEPDTYGYFCNVCSYEYNLKGLNLPLTKIESIICDFINMDRKERRKLQQRHLDCIEPFTNESCQHSMDKLKNISMPNVAFKFNKWIYEVSRVVDRINMKFNSSHPFNLRHKEIKK